MAYLEINDNKGLFFREGEGMVEVNKMTNVLLLYFIIRKFFLVKHAFLLIFLVLLQFALLRCKNIFYFDTKCVF